MEFSEIFRAKLAQSTFYWQVFFLCFSLHLLGEMCNVVKENYGDDKGGFIGGQVFKFSGFVSEEGSVGSPPESDEIAAKMKHGELAIVTFWKSFEQHEKSHADKIFKEKFDELARFCDETYELGYEMLWQGVPEDE